MAMTVMSNYNNVYESRYKNVTAKEETAQTTANSKQDSTSDYITKLAKLVPSVEFKVGNGFSTAKTGKTLTVNPKLIEKMKNDPEQEKETMELIKGVESMTKLVDGINKATGRTVVYRHSYIDENGKYCSISYTKKDDKLNAKLREKTKKNTEQLIEKSKEKITKKKEDLQKILEKKKTEKGNQKTDNIEEFINEKIANAENGIIYMNDKDMKSIMKAAEQNKQQNSFTANTMLNLKI